MSTKKKHGGKREGAGRPSLGITKKVSLTLTNDVWQFIENAESKSKFLRKIITKAFQEQNDVQPVKASRVLNEEEVKENAREELWWELVQKFIFEGKVEIGKKSIRELLDHRKISNIMQEKIIGNLFQDVKKGKKLEIYYLHGYFFFQKKRIPFHPDFEPLVECVGMALIESVMKNFD